MSKKILISFGVLVVLAMQCLPVLAAKEKSSLNNGNVTLESLSQSGNSSVTANLISRGGANANNVAIHLDLRDSGGQTVDGTVLNTDIVHERPTPVTLQIKPGLSAGNYTAAVTVYNNSDQLLNAIFDNAGTVTIGGEAATDNPSNPTSVPTAPVVEPMPTNVAPVTTTPPPAPNQNPVVSSTNPFSGKAFYVDPNSEAKHQVDLWRQSRPGDAAQINKIATVAQARWFGDWNSNIENDIRGLITTANQQGAYPTLVLYNIPGRDCGGYSAGGSNNPDSYKNWIQGVVRGLGSGNAAVILEPDGLASLDCLSSSDQQTRFDLLSYAVGAIKAQGHTAVYLDAGHPNWIGASQMASRLQRAGVSQADGFALNVSNFYSTNENSTYGQAISQALGGKHFVIDTSRNGAGSQNGEWCNPSGRALGTATTASTGNSLVDAFLWLKPPGQSDGTCNGGPNAGQWWADYALGLAQRASW